MDDETPVIDARRVRESIELLRLNLNEDDIAGFLQILQSIADSPAVPGNIEKLSRSLNEVNIMQGAILTYAPYVGYLLSENLVGVPT